MYLQNTKMILKEGKDITVIVVLSIISKALRIIEILANFLLFFLNK